MAERTFIKLTFLKIDPAWQRREGEPGAEDSGARCCFRVRDPAADLPELARLAADGAIDLAGVVTQLDTLDGLGDALDRLRRGEGVRTVLVLDPEAAGTGG